MQRRGVSLHTSIKLKRLTYSYNDGDGKADVTDKSKP